MEQLTLCTQKAVLAKMAVNINLEKGTLWGLCMAGGAGGDLGGRDPGGIFFFGSCTNNRAKGSVLSSEDIQQREIGHLVLCYLKIMVESPAILK